MPRVAPSAGVGPGETLDSLGRTLSIVQRAKGYRFNLDSVLLAAFGVSGLDERRALSAVDLGTGSGIIALLLASWRPRWTVSAVEVQPSLVTLARRNAALNNLAVEVVEQDWRSLGTPGRVGHADLVVCNPPYYAADRGERCVDEEKAAARQELHGDLQDNIRAASRVVRGSGRVRFIHAASRATEVISAFETAGLGVRRLRFVHAKPVDPAYAVLIDAAPGLRRPLTVEPPLVVHRTRRIYSAEVADLLAGKTPV
jgi:tRNA1Val (adenine37-N6)-methyltransferase